MKSKDLGFFTKHVEKIIIAAGVLVLGLILLLYVVGDPYAVTVKGNKLNATELEAKIEETANQLSTRLNTYNDFPEKTVFPWGVNFEKRLKDAASALQTLPAPVSGTGLDTLVGTPPDPPTAFDLPQPPMPTEVVFNSNYAVFDPLAGQESLEASQVDQVLQMIGSPPAGMPADFPYVSLEGKFDLDEWLSRLESPDARNPIPRAFWRGRQVITAVYLQRQELDPATGEWSEPVIVEPLPTQLSYTPTYSRNYTDAEAQGLIQFIKDRQEPIARAPFVPVAAHARQWLPPERAGNLTPEEHRKLDDLNRKINRLEKSIKTVQENILKAQQHAAQQNRATRSVAPRAAAPSIPDPTDMMGGGGSPTGRSTTRAGTQRAPVAASLTREQEMQQKLQRDIAELQEARTELNELLGIGPDVLGQNNVYPGGTLEMYENFQMYDDPFGTAMPGAMPGAYGPPGMMDPYGGAYGPPGYGPPGGAYAPGAYSPTQPNIDPRTGRPVAPSNRGQPGAPAEDMTDGLTDRVVKVWAHDLTVERGKTYRYRLCVAVMNPLFRKPRVEQQQKSDNFNKIALGPSQEELDATPWTEAIAIPPEYRFFFTEGTEQRQYATIEVWRYFDGKPQSKEFTVYPGDPIGGEAEVEDGTTIDMHVGAVLVDLVSDRNRSGLGSTTKMLFIEPDSAQIQSRTLDQDKDSDERLRLENERLMIEALTGGFASSASAAP